MHNLVMHIPSIKHEQIRATKKENVLNIIYQKSKFIEYNKFFLLIKIISNYIMKNE